MTRKRQRTLKRPLIVQPLLVQLFTLVVSFMVLLALLVRLDSGGEYTNQTITKIAANAIVRDSGGGLAVQMTPELQEVRDKSKNLWFVAVDDTGRRITYGQIPAQYASVAAALHQLSHADLRDASPPYLLSAVIRRERGPAGAFTILGHGELTRLTMAVALGANVVVIPIFVLLGLVTAIMVPWIVKRSLAGVAKAAKEAELIDVDRRGNRLAEDEVPREIAPLVRAMNDALSRLDEGYEQQRRFIASAAHELLTPIAILRVKIEADDSEFAHHVLGDIARLSMLAEQLLDVQRLEKEELNERVDLAKLVRRVAADLAPLLIASDKTIEVLADDTQPVVGNVGAIERVVTNLVYNAVEHGGRHVIVRAHALEFEVEDDGPGIPLEERERVFEPFHRLHRSPTGTGLGLHLVKQVIERHHGNVTILDAPSGGAIVRVRFRSFKDYSRTQCLHNVGLLL
jgi:two-component system, OmpR family, sensor histidine kinase TctE